MCWYVGPMAVFLVPGRGFEQREEKLK